MAEFCLRLRIAPSEYAQLTRLERAEFAAVHNQDHRKR